MASSSLAVGRDMSDLIQKTLSFCDFGQIVKTVICVNQKRHNSRCDALAPIILRRIGPMWNVNLDFKNYVNTVLVSLWQKKVLKNVWCTRKTA